MHSPNKPGATGATVAIEFIERLFSIAEQPVYVCSLPNEKNDPSEPGERHVATRDAGDVTKSIEKWDRAKRGLYICVSTIKAGMARKKDGVAEICFLFADIDFKDIIDDRETVVRRLKSLKHPPSIIVHSGNGLHCYWLFNESLTVNVIDGAETIERVEAALKLLCDMVGGDQSVTQVAALMRLPGTHNSKHDEWKPVEVIERNDGRFELDDLETMISETSPIVLRKLRPDQTGEVNQFTQIAASMSFKPPIDVEQRLAAMLYMGGGDAAIHVTQLAVSASLLNHGIDVDEVVRLVLDATKAAAGDYGARWNWRREENAIRRMCATWQKKREGDQTKPKDVAPKKIKRHIGEPNWRECRVNGSPLPSMHNARLGISALGIECSYDTFHNKIRFGFKDDATQHRELQSLLGDVSDNGIIALRLLMSDKFGFDLTEKYVRDAVISLAIEHCFDPVCDMIDKAEAEWDGVERLDRMAVTHFNCAETPLNRACLRKTMIAMIARARNPGCKFDTITVLESPEGLNKSTAWRVLAGDENFSDEAIIGKGSREVQEQLAGTWVHENAELAGMRKAEIETVKAFASRMVDIARAAYGHFPIRQKRHSIEVGSTNGDEYLQSQTGNRRFWPLKILSAIDEGLLRADRLQLIGEAARYQSSGESIVLDKSMWADAGIEQEKRRTKDAWEDVLAVIPTEVEIDKGGYYGNTKMQPILDLIEDQERVASADLLLYVLKIPIGQQGPAHTMRLSTAMKHLGWERGSNKITVRGKQVRGYFRAVTGEQGAAIDDGVSKMPKPKF